LDGSDRAGYLFLSLLQARVGSSLISRLGGREVASLMQTPLAELRDRVRMSEKAVRAFEELKSVFDAKGLEERLAGNGIAVLTPADAGYPARLKDVPDPPPALFVRGELPEATSVALVGSRKASATGIETSRALGRALGERGVCVVSGLALGVDAAAHEGALDGGAKTVGVLGCGIDVVYPRENSGLFEAVGRGGAVVSEYGPGEAPLAWRFPARNRIIAGLSDVVVVVEAPEKSGALITARHALEAGRDVWAVPGPPGAAECRGSNRLLADGAGVLWDVAEFADALGEQGARAVTAREPVEVPPPPVGLPATEEAVLSGVGFEATGVDAVARRAGIEMRRVLPALALLELKGFVRRDAVGAYTRRPRP
jgi:DNA processing protein